MALELCRPGRFGGLPIGDHECSLSLFGLCSVPAAVAAELRDVGKGV